MAEPGPPNAQGPPPVSTAGLDHIDINAIPDAPGETPECRICGGPAEPDAPLFYPCKCSGTIRYIHQACLTTWLKHSKKQSCDLCKHPYAFTKVYKEDMPNIIPPHVFLKRLVKQFVNTMVMGARAWLVICVWVVLVPWITVWVWRIYFWVGNQFAWNVYGPLAPDEPPFGRPNSTDTLELIAQALSSPITLVNTTYWEAVKSRWQHPEDEEIRARFLAVVRDQHERVGSDVIKGQIVTASLVVAFLAIFLLREWIIQNAVPGMFGDDGLDLGQLEDAPVEVGEAELPVDDAELQAQDAALEAELFDRMQQFRAQLANPPFANAQGGQVPELVIPRRRGWEQDQDEHSDTEHLIPIKSEGFESNSPITPRPNATRIPSDGPLFPADEQPFAFGASSSNGPLQPPVTYETFQFKRQQMGAAQSSRVGPTVRVPDLTDPSVKSLDVHVKRSPPIMITAQSIKSGEPSRPGASTSVLPSAVVQPGAPTSRLGAGSKLTSPSSRDPPPLFAGPPPSRTHSLLAGPTTIDSNLKESRGTNVPTSAFTFRPPTEVNLEGENQNPFLDPVRQNPFATKSTPAAEWDAEAERMTQSGKGKAKEESPELDELEEFDRYFKETPRDAPPQNSFEFDEQSYKQELARSRSTLLQDGRVKEEEVERSTEVDSTTDDAVTDVEAEEAGSTSVQASEAGVADLFASPPTGFVIPEGTKFPSKFQFTFTPKVPDGDRIPSLNFTSTPLAEPVSTEKPLTPSESQAGPSRRPPLPPTTPNEELPPLVRPAWQGDSAAGSSTTLPTKPLGTPSVVTYRAPEQLEEDKGYFPPIDTEVLAQPGDISRTATPMDQDESMDDGNTDMLLDSDSEWGGEIREAQVPGAFQAGAEEVRGPANVQNVVNPPQPPALQEALPAAEPVAAARPEDDVEGMVEDEVEGAMEAIGMRGPLIQLVQNAVLVQVLLYITMAVGLCLPFVVGKTTLLLTLRPHRTLFVLKQPLVVIRLATDPFVDLLFWCARPLLRLIPKSIPPQVTDQTSSLQQIAAFVLSRVGSGATTPEVTPSTPSLRVPQILASLFTEQLAVAQGFQLNITVNVTVPDAVAESATSFLESWTALVKGDGPRERGFAIAWGYLSTAIVFGAVLEWMGSNIGPTLRAIRSIIRQQVILIKVLVFITIELIIFPLGCGILLDLNTLPLFPSGTLQRRIAFLQYAPFTSIFLHWLLGTMFMYQFAVVLSACRAAMRPGALWFIKDPSDPNFHPIRDILDRPTTTQMRKLGSSAMLYSGVLTIGIGSVLLALRRMRFGAVESPLLPLRTSKLEPLSEIPFDLLFLHIVAPVTLTRLRPKRVLRYLLDKWWRMTSQQLRLSSFMFGNRFPEEEQYDTRSWLARLNPNSVPCHEFQGRLARAPATDALALSSDQPVLIQVNEKGEPQSERGAILMRSQNEACERAGLQVADAFTVTYLPPHFRLRILYFTCCLWFFGTIVLLWCVAGPIYIGRGWVYAAGYAPIHDAYTWTIGLYTLISCLLVWKELKRLHRRGVPTPQRFLRNVIVNGGQTLYLVIMIGIILPILVSMVVDFHVVLPLRLWLGHVQKPELHLAESWAIGLIYIKMGMRAARVDGENDLYQAWQRILLAGWRNPDAIAATKDFIAPIGGPILVMLVAPYLIIDRVQFYYGQNDPLAAFRYGYPAVFYVAAVVVMSGRALKNLQKWTQGIRDAEFLVEMRLTNLERGDKETPSSSAQPTTPATPEDPQPPMFVEPQPPLAPLLPLDMENEA